MISSRFCSKRRDKALLCGGAMGLIENRQKKNEAKEKKKDSIENF